MSSSLVMASGSQARQQMLNAAGISFTIDKPMIDEVAIKSGLQSEGYAADEIADALAEAKARKISNRHPEALVIGSDQTLSFGGQLLSKPSDKEDAISQLMALSGKTHDLYAAAVLYRAGEPQWRLTKRCRMTMRRLSEGYIHDYCDRNFDEIRHCVGGYQIEAEGSRLFARVEADQFSIMGLPLIELLNHLTLIGAIDG